MSFQDENSENPFFEKQIMKLKFYIIVLLLLMAYCILACSPQSNLTAITSTKASQIPVAPKTLSPTPPSPGNFFTKTPQPSPLSMFTVAIPTSSIVDGWLVYRNPIYNYEFSYPIGTTLKISSVESFPGELPAGLTFEEYLLQLQNQFGDLCVVATYREGFVLIQAPNAWDYVLCGGFGVGADVVVEKSEVVSVNGKSYSARGWELYKKEGDNTILYSEFFFVDIEDGTHFAYGSNLEKRPERFDDYLAIKEILLRMLASYRTIE